MTRTLLSPGPRLRESNVLARSVLLFVTLVLGCQAEVGDENGARGFDGSALGGGFATGGAGNSGQELGTGGVGSPGGDGPTG